MACQPIWDYFLQRDELLCSFLSFFSHIVIWYQVFQCNTSNFETNLWPIGLDQGEPESNSNEQFVCLFKFYGISTLEGYLMPNPVYTFISNIYNLLTHFADNIFQQAWVHSFLHTLNWFQGFLSNTKNSIYY